MTRENNNYYGWFKKIVNTCIVLFFLFSLISNLFVYVSIFEGVKKYLFFALILAGFLVFAYYFKDRIKGLLQYILQKLSALSFRRLLWIIVITSVAIKGIYYIFFFFDPTKYGEDITIYASIADSIVENGLESVNRSIYYLVGMGMHLSVFKRLSIPYHVGIYLVFLLGTVINYYSFSKYIGKEKAFLLIELYLLMPSTSLLTFCITHELFVYLYFSIIFVILNLFLEKEDIKDLAIYGILLTVFVSLNQTVSPMGKIWFILLFLIAVLTRMDMKKRIAVLLIILLSYSCANMLTTSLEGNKMSQNNNYEQLLIGSDLESMGRHTDGKGKRSAEAYWEARGTYLTTENFIEGQRGALIEQYKYLITHPHRLIELLANKFYVAWSGDYYSVEYAYNMGSIDTLMYYLMLGTGALIWLFAVSTALVFYKNKDTGMAVYNYKIILLGVMAVLLITEIMNKYSCYMTLFIYFIGFTMIDIKSNNRGV